MATQLDLIPLTIVEYQPFPGKPGKGRAVSDTGVAYFVKSDNDIHCCATEWVSNHVAEALNLPVTQTKVLQFPDGKLVVGSELMTNRLPDYQVGALLLRGERPNDLYLPALNELLSQIYALDLALGNHDRHEENYLVSIETSDDGRRTGNLRPFDFESADILRRTEIRLPMNPTSNTMRKSKVILDIHGFSAGPADQLLTRFRQGREFIMDGAIRGLPKEWLPVSQRDAFMARVASKQFGDEILKLQQGLKDGTYR
ncbi:MAG: hypothetical protein JWR51_2303 [Devosia sp.]|uniref:hypothetical protein n=1 Tax=Devosia sp. TaxID=1871048 RepID=UPI00262DA9AC|nr:hypothetical protein [Devosia sp.]MDB5529200.1 hypothetical protein [Devosia sp.]